MCMEFFVEWEILRWQGPRGMKVKSITKLPYTGCIQEAYRLHSHLSVIFNLGSYMEQEARLEDKWVLLTL